MANTNSARIAFVGTGNHATGSLYPNIAHIPEFDLVAVCDLDPVKAAYAARRYGATEWFTDVETMLDHANPQGVCICGPAEMHAQVAMQVLQRGIPVFVEKPPAGTLEDAIRVAETAKANNTWGMVAFMKRFAPANIVAKEFMASAEFGALSSITLIHGSGPYNDLRPMLYFNGIHMIDLARFFGGEIIEVFAYAHRSLERAHAISATFQFAEGGVGQFNLNSGHTWQDCFEQVYLSGTKAGITIDASRTTEVMSPARHFAQADGYQLYGWVGRYAVSGNMAGWEAGGHYTRGYWGELQQFARSLTGQAEPVPSLADGVKAIQLIEAILTSVETHQPVVLARDALPLVAGATQ